jgi:integrase
VRHALVILNALFAWLTDAGYLAGNPLALARRRRAPTKPRITRYLSHDLWDAVKDTVAAMPTETARERLHAARCRWLLTVLYLGGLRAAEVTGTAMGAFFCRRDAQGVERWWLEVTGKGNKTRLVPATDELIAELARYRRVHGLAPTPQPGETRPLLLPMIGREGHENRDKGLSRGALHLILKEVFGLAAGRLRARGPEWEAQAALLASASAHWLRHTAGSHMTDQQLDHPYSSAKRIGLSISSTMSPPIGIGCERCCAGSRFFWSAPPRNLQWCAPEPPRSRSCSSTRWPTAMAAPTASSSTTSCGGMAPSRVPSSCRFRLSSQKNRRTSRATIRSSNASPSH